MVSSITDWMWLPKTHMEIEGDCSAQLSTCETWARLLYLVLDSAVWKEQNWGERWGREKESES